MRISKRPKIVKDFKTFIMTKRVDAGLSLDKLGKMSGVTGSYLCRVEKGVQQPTMETMARIMNALGIRRQEGGLWLVEKSLIEIERAEKLLKGR